MKSAEFVARVSELDRCAPHMSPSVTLWRLVELVEEFGEGAAGEGFPRLPGLRDASAEFGVPPREAEAGEPAPEREPEREPEPPEPAPEEIPEPEIEVTPPEAPEPDPAPASPAIAAETEPEEEKKPCRKCGEEKPLSKFGKDVRTAAGRAHVCSECRSAGARKAARTREKNRREAKSEAREEFEAVGRASHAPEPDPAPEAEAQEPSPAAPGSLVENLKVTRLPRAERAPEPEEVAARHRREKRPAVYCANGDRCSSPGIEGPSPLAPGKKQGDLCFVCEEVATGRFGAGA